MAMDRKLACSFDDSSRSSLQLQRGQFGGERGEDQTRPGFNSVVASSRAPIGAIRLYIRSTYIHTYCSITEERVSTEEDSTDSHWLESTGLYCTVCTYIRLNDFMVETKRKFVS